MTQELYTFDITNSYDNKSLKGKLKREEMESLLELIIRDEEERNKFLDSRKGKNAVKIIEKAAEKHGIIAKERYKEAFIRTLKEYFCHDIRNPFSPEKKLLPRWRKIHKEYKSLTIESRREEVSRRKKEFLDMGIKTSGDYLKAIFSYDIHQSIIIALESWYTAIGLYEFEFYEKALPNGWIPLQIVEDVLTKGGSKVYGLFHIEELKKGYYDKLSEEARKELDRLEEWYDNLVK